MTDRSKGGSNSSSGSRSRWVGPPVAPQNERGKSPSGRQRHYGAVELPGVGQQVYVNDVVEVLPKHNNSGNSEKERSRLSQCMMTSFNLKRVVDLCRLSSHKSVRSLDTAWPRKMRECLPRLYSDRSRTYNGWIAKRHNLLIHRDVLSMWEDAFTGVFKFRARWLIHAGDLPEDALSRLHAARRAFSNDSRSSEGDTRGGDAHSNDEGDDEVFLTPRMDDLEVRMIVRPVTLSVTPSPKTEIPANLEGKMGPRFTHTYDDSTGDFVPVEDTDPILKRARVRQSEAVAFASRVNQEHEAAKNGEPVKSNGWLLPKRRVFDRKGRGEIGSYYGRGHEVHSGPRSVPVSHVPVGSPIPDVDMEISNDSEPEDVPNSKDEEWKEDDDGDGDTTDTDDDLPRSPKQITNVKGDFTPRKSARQRKCQRSSDNDAKVNNDPLMDYHPCAPKLSLSSPRRGRSSAAKGARPLPPRPRRLDMPPVSEEGDPVVVPDGEDDAHTAIDHRVATKQNRSPSMRVANGPRVKNSNALPRSSSLGSLTSAAGQPTVSGKKRRNGSTTTNTSADGDAESASKMAENISDYPPRHTPVGKEFQAVIPDMLSYEERKRPAAGTGARMVWRSIRDWDPQSRGLLAEYLHAAKKVVQEKQARPGVAVHVRLGGSYGGVGQEDDPIDNMDCTGSYAVWAVTAGRDACGVVRVACSEMAQTEVPRSAVQRVQSEEEALAALVKARCVLDNFEPALDLLANTSLGPQSVEQWTLTQVRTLERALDDEFYPKRRLHGWARPGMAMDREDFIDLAKVSKQVPGKTPAQVLAFYYRYLAAAEPLTDVVYGPKAAEARRQEEVPPDSGAGNPHYWRGGLARGSSHPCTLRAGANQALDGLQRASPAIEGGSGSGSGNNLLEPALSSRSQGVRISPSKPAQEPTPRANKTDVSKSTTSDLTASHVSQTEAEPPLRQFPTGPLSSGGATSSHGGKSSRDVDGITSVGCGPREGSIETSVAINFKDKESGRSVRHETTPEASAATNKEVDRDADAGRARHILTQQGRRAEQYSSGNFKGLPPDAEVFEVQDSDDETRTSSQPRSDASRRTPPLGSDAKAPLPKSVVEAAAKHLSTLGPQGLQWVARKMRAPSVPVSARNAQPPPTYSVQPQPAAPKSGGMEQQRTGLATYTPYAVQMRDAGLTEGQRHAIWNRRPAPHPMPHASHVRRPDGRPSYGVGNNSSMPELGVVPPSRNAQQPDEEAPTDDMFGAMAPCWRLLERAKAYMDKDQLVYMRGLILTHVKKPMSRDQLLERVESCLQEQGHIFAAFVKMFDRIDQSPSVPLYPMKRVQAAPSPTLPPRAMVPYPSTYNHPAAIASRSESLGSARYVPVPRTFRGEPKAVPPSDARSSGAGGSRSPPGRVFSRAPPSATMPGGGWWPPRVGSGGGVETGGGGFAQYPLRRNSPVMPLLTSSRQGAPHLDYAIYDGGVASRNVGSHQSPHQPPQWRMGSGNSLVAVAAVAVETAKRDEARRGSTWGSSSGR